MRKKDNKGISGSSHLVRISSIVWGIICIPLAIFLFYKLSPRSNEQIYEDCLEQYSEELNDRIINAYYNGQGSVIVKLSSGKEVSWHGGYYEFVKYRSGLRNYPGKSLLNGLFKNDEDAYFRIDSLYKPANSFDFHIYINSDPDSLIQLACDFECTQRPK